jgi:hypothetical protein
MAYNFRAEGLANIPQTDLTWSRAIVISSQGRIKILAATNFKTVARPLQDKHRREIQKLIP